MAKFRRGRRMHGPGVLNNRDFRLISRFISEMVRYKHIYNGSDVQIPYKGVISNDLG